MTTPSLLLERFDENVAKQSDKVALTFLNPGPNGGKVERQWTYEQVAEESRKVAEWLDAHMERGERAVLVYPPSLDFMVAFLGCLRAGIVAVPVFPPHPHRRDTLAMFSSIVAGCGAKVALTSAAYSHQQKMAGLQNAFGRLVGKRKGGGSWPEHLQWIVTDQLGAKRAKSTRPSFGMPQSSDLAFLQYTSGSTSEPKGVMITHGNLAHNLTIITTELQAVEDTVVVSWLPLYHDMGLIGSFLGALYCGGSGFYLSPLSFVQRPMIWIEAISNHNATHIQAPNFAFKLTARKFDVSQYAPGTLNLSSIRHVINAAEPVDETSIDSFCHAFEPFGFRRQVMFPTYGLAEHTVFVCSGGTQRLTVDKHELEANGMVRVVTMDAGVSENDAFKRLLGCGYPQRQGVHVRIVDPETQEELPNDHVGEIWIQSPSKAAGYFNKPDESHRDFEATLATGVPETFLRTGDLGFLHQQEVFICGRLKDLIIVGGRNYYPQDIEFTAEEVAAEYIRPGCSAAFTVDPLQEAGEQVALVMEIREVPTGENKNEVCQKIIETVRSSVNSIHSLRLTHLILVKPRTVPKTSSGKIARSWCRKGFLANSLQTVHRQGFEHSQDADVDEGEAVERGPLEIESEAPASPPGDASEIRNMDKAEILKRLKADIASVGSLPASSVDSQVPLNSLLDSLSLSQLQGMLEGSYATRLSDEYLFRDDCTVDKLVEVVKLGYAPDDGAAGTGGGGGTVPQSQQQQLQNKGGLAQALGCPPGVVCCTVM